MMGKSRMINADEMRGYTNEGLAKNEQHEARHLKKILGEMMKFAKKGENEYYVKSSIMSRRMFEMMKDAGYDVKRYNHDYYKVSW